MPVRKPHKQGRAPRDSRIRRRVVVGHGIALIDGSQVDVVFVHVLGGPAEHAVPIQHHGAVLIDGAAVLNHVTARQESACTKCHATQPGWAMRHTKVAKLTVAAAGSHTAQALNPKL